MTSSNQPRTYPQGWADPLREAVLSPGRRWTTAETMSVLLAARELEGWLGDSRPYDGQHKPGWRSALADFLHSASNLGPELQAALDSHLKDAIDAAESLNRDFTVPSKANMGDVLQGRRGRDQLVFTGLRAQWAAAEVREAAWDDLAEACRDVTVGYDVLAIRRDLFWEIMEAGDHDVHWMGDLLSGVLRDSAFYIAQAGIWLGDIIGTQSALLRHDHAAGLPEGKRLALCRRILTAPPVDGHYVAWAAFDHAGPGSVRETVGPISFWDSKWVRAVLEQRDGNLPDIPEELQATDGIFKPDLLPDAPDVRLARVDLGTGAWTDPLRVARDQAEAVVVLAGFNVGHSYWRLMRGHLVTIDGRVRSLAAFSGTRDEQDTPSTLYQEAMDVELASLASTMREHLPVTDRKLSEVIQAVHWWQQARRQPPLTAVLLHVRVLELLSQRVGGYRYWHQYTDQHLKSWWVRWSMVCELADIVSTCLASSGRVPDPADRVQLERIERDMTALLPGGKRRREYNKAIDALPTLASIFPPQETLGRRIRDLGERLDPKNLPSWRDALTRDWQLTLARLVRLRNSLAHGGPIEDDSAETVRLFVQQVAGQALTVALEGTLNGQGVAAASQAHKQQFDDWMTGLTTVVSTALDVFTV